MASQRTPAWIWIFTLAVAAAFLAFLFFLSTVPVPENPTESASTIVDDVTSEFDFYKILPELSVPKDSSALKTDPANNASTNNPTDKIKASESAIYFLQTGSFQNAKDADTMRASLLLEGFNVRIEKVDIQQSGTWHRVQVGPFTDRKAINQAQDRLAQADLESLLIKLSKKP